MEISLHLLSLIIFCGITTGSILALQLWLFPWGNRRANQVLSLHLATCTILAVAFVFCLERPDLAVNFHIIFSLQLLVGPLMYFYTRLMTETDFHWHKQHFWHTLPALLMALVWQLQLPLKPDGLVNQTCVNSEACDLLYRSRSIHRWSTYLSLTAYAIASLRLLQPYLQRLKKQLSAIEEVNLSWLKVLIAFQLTIILLAIVLEFRSLLIIDSWTPGLLMSLSPLILAILMGWFGLQQRNIQITELPSVLEPETEAANNTDSQKYQTSSLSTDRGEAIWRLLQRTMEQEHPYLEPGLKIADLADRMGIPSHHLSEVLNGYAQQSFYDFINHYRVNDAARQLRDPGLRHLSVTDIGLQAGFNSNSAYFTHFKKRHHQTPRQYRQQALSQLPVDQ